MSINIPGFKPKLIAVDFDGTMLNNKSELSARTETALRRAAASGVAVIGATGRMYVSALPFLKRIGAVSPCVVFNGAQLRDPTTDGIVYEQALSAELTAEILSFYRKNNWYVQIYSGDQLLVEDDRDERCTYYEGVSRVKAVPLGQRFWDFVGPSVKILGIAMESEVYADMVEKTAENFRGQLYTATSWGSYIEMVHPQVNKARALAMVAEGLGICREEVLAFGDGSNDREMLEWAGVGVAMNNAAASVKESADCVAPSNEDDGVAAVLERLFEWEA